MYVRLQPDRENRATSHLVIARRRSVDDTNARDAYCRALFVEPIRVAGREWVTRRTLVGYGGGLPRGFTEEGNFFVVSKTEAKFVADGVANLRFKIAPDPRPYAAVGRTNPSAHAAMRS